MKIHSIDELLALPDGTRVIPFGYENHGERMTTTKSGSRFGNRYSVCPAKFMGLPATVITEEEVRTP